MALTFNGTSDGISVTDVAALEASATNVTLSCWVMRDGAQAQFDRIVDKEYDNAGSSPFVSYSLDVGTTDGVTWSTGTAAGIRTGAEVALTDLTWTHLCGVYDKDASPNMILYKDGTSAASSTVAASDLVYSGTGNQLDIGARDAASTAANFFKGSIAEVAMWPVTLTVSEIVALAKGYTPAFIRPSQIAFYAPLIRSYKDVINKAAAAVTGTTVGSHSRIIMPARPLIGHNSAGAPAGLDIPIAYHHYRTMHAA